MITPIRLQPPDEGPLSLSGYTKDKPGSIQKHSYWEKYVPLHGCTHRSLTHICITKVISINRRTKSSQSLDELNGRCRQGDQVLKATPGYVVSSKLTWAAGDHVSRNQISTKPKISNPGVRTLYYTSEVSEKLNFMIDVQIDRYLTHCQNGRIGWSLALSIVFYTACFSDTLMISITYKT